MQKRYTEKTEYINGQTMWAEVVYGDGVRWTTPNRGRAMGKSKNLPWYLVVKEYERLLINFLH